MSNLKPIKITIAIFNMLFMGCLIIFDILDELRQHEITWIIILLSFSFSLVYLIFEWIEFKYLDDNEKYYAELEAQRFKRYLKHIKREILSYKK